MFQLHRFFSLFCSTQSRILILPSNSRHAPYSFRSMEVRVCMQHDYTTVYLSCCSSRLIQGIMGSQKPAMQGRSMEHVSLLLLSSFSVIISSLRKCKHKSSVVWCGCFHVPWKTKLHGRKWKQKTQGQTFKSARPPQLGPGFQESSMHFTKNLAVSRSGEL